MKKIISSAILCLLVFSVFTSQVFYAEEIQRQATSIKGVGAKITCSYQKELERNITVSPSNGGRTVRLQIYSSKYEKYVTLKTYKTADSDAATVKIVFPKERRRRCTGQWKIVVEKSAAAEKAEKKIKVTTTNIVTKNITAGSACIYCVDDNQLIYGKLITKRRKMASVTKIMTAYVLLENAKLSEQTKVSKNAAKTPYACLNMKAGDIYTYKSLMYSLMLPSSNDAATAIAEGVGGSSKKFAKLMNAKADELGLKNTHFVTPHGLDAKGHYSSAWDICVIMGNVYSKSPAFRKVIASSKYSFTTKKYKQSKTVYTTDSLKGYSKKHKGGKTGFTTPAGYCFCGVYEHGGKTYVATVLHSSSGAMRWSDTKKLYEYIDKYASKKY